MSERDIAAVVVTVDRSPTAPNYLAETLGNLARSGAFASPRLASFDVVDSGSLVSGFVLDAAVRAGLADAFRCGEARSVGSRRTANENVAVALEVGAGSGARWVLFLEDDVDVIDDFVGSVGAWLDDHARPDRIVCALGANYPQAEGPLPAWDYRIEAFYGTQAFAIRADDAVDLARWLRAHVYDKNIDGTAYDLHMQDWAFARGERFFLASAPSFVQHVGRESVIRPRASTHTFPSWPGRAWRYGRKAVAS